MASVNSPLRNWIKPLLFKLLPESWYRQAQFYAKKKDITNKLVEEQEMEMLPLFLKPDSNSIDIGANYAYYTVRLAQIATKGMVYAFEPIGFTYKVCKQIVDSFKLKNVQLYAKGVGNQNTTATFNVPTLSFGAISAGQAHLHQRNNELKGKEKHYKFNSSKQEQATIVKLDDFLLPQIPPKNRIDFIKIDIEGAEYFALEGMQQLIQTYNPLILIEINPFFLQGFGINEQQLKQLINLINYNIYCWNSSTQKLKPYTDTSFVEKNYILLPNKHLDKFNSLLP